MRSGSLIREQIINRDASVLYSAICLMRDESAEGGMLDIDSNAGQMELVLKISNLRGVIGVRLFDINGKFVNGLPVSIREGSLEVAECNYLKLLVPCARYHDSMKLSDLFYFSQGDDGKNKMRISVLEINIPLHKKNDSNLLAIAQFFIEGETVENEFAILDRNLNRQALITFLVGAVLIVAGLGFAFLKLYKRTLDLQRANRELALAARTSALGAIAANLLHGLKNPIAGLQLFATDKAANGGDSSDEDWQEVMKSIQKMRTMINEVSTFIKEESGITDIELSAEEIAEMVLSKTAPRAKEMGVNLSAENNCKGVNLPGRVANLISIILVNLIENAIEATPPGHGVRLLCSINGGGVLMFQVIDEGCGLSATIAENPFMPRYSSKPGGCGIGLAISKQLANHIGANLQLKWTKPGGTCFELSLPIK
ncbi:MAG: HAMP domain-containing histidine kinase [Verrucomicrobiae bacterium]|nr:HAMP domain-containing histidine kinase [Verrucomicrobiae bacterium]